MYVNHLSNYHGIYSIQGNLLVSCGGLKHLNPDIIITIGGQTGDYSIYNALNLTKNTEHWRVCEDGNVVNTYNRLNKIFECPAFYFFNRMKKICRLTILTMKSGKYEQYNELQCRSAFF